MDYLKNYEKWIEEKHFDGEMLNELYSIKSDKDEIKDRFYKDLQFGTGGIRGVIGAGTNRINKYTIAKATQGLSDYLNDTVVGSKTVVIAYDTRHMSKEFAETTACVLAANNIRVHLFNNVSPTPLLSYSVGQLKADVGIVITASHNPAEYNGYKVYWSDGGQICTEKADQITKSIKKIKEYSQIKNTNIEHGKKDGLILTIGCEMEDRYVKDMIALRSGMTDQNKLNIVYTPLHGAGSALTQKILSMADYKNIHIVKEQECPDPKFSTVKSPNPEEADAFKLSIEYAKKHNADIIIGSDPDGDRIGLLVKSNNDYKLLNGNQIGVLLLDYLLRDLPNTDLQRYVAIKTIVTSDLGLEICNSYNVEMIETLTGFKYIGEQIEKLTNSSGKLFLIGFEESNGYLTNTLVRDKDAVSTSLIICEMAEFYLKSGITLHDRLNEMYEQYGYYHEVLYSVNLDGVEGQNNIKKITEHFNDKFDYEMENEKITKILDYKKSICLDLKNNSKKHIHLPAANVIKWYLEDDSWIALRPSGTEPKLKIYFSIKGSNEKDAEKRSKLLISHFRNIINRVIYV